MEESRIIKVDKHSLTTQNFPFISKPSTVAEYTVNRERNVEIGRMNANNLYEVPLRSKPDSFLYDLDIGFDSFDPKEGEEKLEVLLKWIEKMAPNGGRLKKAVHEADIVCWRGLLTRIGVTVYDPEETWRFRAIRHKGVIFLCEEETNQKVKRKEQTTDREKHMTYWGHKFEQYLTVHDFEEQPNTDVPVSTREEFASVVRTSLQNSSKSLNKRTLELLYSAEVDCIDKEGKYVELKTHKGELQGWFWTGTKSLKWWLQSFLVAIETVVVGHRNDHGHVQKVTSIRTEEIQKRAKWYGGACIRFISVVLSSVCENLQQDDVACVVEFGGSSSKGVMIRRVSPQTCDFVPHEFLNKYS